MCAVLEFRTVNIRALLLLQHIPDVDKAAPIPLLKLHKNKYSYWP